MSKKETAKRIPGIYIEDDGSITDVRSDGRVINNVKERFYDEPFSYGTHIKPTLNLIKKSGSAIFKDLKTAIIDTPLAVNKAIYNETATAVQNWNQKNQQKRAKDMIIWSERHNKYMSQYDLRIQDIKDASKINE
tara:strand:- start:178 stop:582 length:405 start_codon:yes stop_codon:yes gene_type:complete